MIVIVAPFSPVTREGNPALGAARKIQVVIDILATIDSEIVLVNSAHNSISRRGFNVCVSEISGKNVTEIILPTYSNRILGKFINLWQVSSAIGKILKLGSPKMIWIYNGYAFESLFVIKFRKIMNSPIIMEFEDWIFSRGRGFNPKPIIDWIFWRKAIKLIKHVFAVNKCLAMKIEKFNISVSLFPGVVGENIERILSAHPPFTNQTGKITVGYFGGLTEEKGANQVLALPFYLPDNYIIIVTGAGPLEESFKELAIRSRGKLEFYGCVDDKMLDELIARCDVLLNPHSSIQHLSNGVFPFKVIESIASGRMLISTPLPSEELSDVLQGVNFVDYSRDSLIQAILESRDWYSKNIEKIKNGSQAALRLFSKKSIADVLIKNFKS